MSAGTLRRLSDESIGGSDRARGRRGTVLAYSLGADGRLNAPGESKDTDSSTKASSKTESRVLSRSAAAGPSAQTRCESAACLRALDAQLGPPALRHGLVAERGGTRNTLRHSG